MEDVMSKMKRWARDRDLDVTFEDAKEEFAEEYEEVPPHKRRKLKVQFEVWITRCRKR